MRMSRKVSGRLEAGDSRSIEADLMGPRSDGWEAETLSMSLACSNDSNELLALS